MAITLDHTIIPARDKVESAKFFANLFGLAYAGEVGPFAAVPVNETLTFDFEDRRQGYEVHHYAFHVTDAEFDAIFGRVKKLGLTYGSGPFSQNDMQVRSMGAARLVYFHDLGGHLLEIRTKPSRTEIAESASKMSA